MWNLYDYINSKGQNDIEKWWLKLQKIQRARLKQRVDMLRKNGLDLPSEVLADIGKHIYKLKVRGSPQLRPLLCRGTKDNDSEFTFLIGAVEIQYEFEPKDAVETARERRAELLEGSGKRCKHKEVN